MSRWVFDLTEDDVDGTQSHDGVGDIRTDGHIVERLEVAEAGAPVLDAIGRARFAVRDEVDPEVAAGVLDADVRLTLRRAQGFGGIPDGRAARQVANRLFNDAQGLAQLFLTEEVAVVAVAARANGHVEVEAIINGVRLHLADVVRQAGGTKHRTGQAEIDCAFLTNDP